MKNKKYYIFALLFFFSFCTSILGQDKTDEEKELNINLVNINKIEYIKYFFPIMPKKGFIYSNNYIEGKSLPHSSKKSLNFFQQKKIINKMNYTSISSNALDNAGNAYRIEFDISEGYNFENRKYEAIKYSSDLFFNSRNQDINRAFVKDLMESKSIYNLKPIYTKDENITAINGYQFNYKIQPSSNYRVVRTISEILLGCSLGVGNYYMTKFENMVDWQYGYSWDDAKRKVTDGWYWDPNNFNTNTIYHLYAGMSYYQIARSNYYNPWESAAWSVGGSFFWEFFGEWREQVSLNDMIFTPMLGAVTGEAVIQTGHAIERHMESGFLKEAILLIINPFGWVNKKIDAANSGDVRVNLVFVNPIQSKINDKIIEEIR